MICVKLFNQALTSLLLLELNTGLLILYLNHVVVDRSRKIQLNPQNPGKIHKNTTFLVEIVSNTCLYSIFETYLSYWGYLLAINLQIYLETLSLKCANNVPKLPGVDYVAKNWALAMMLIRLCHWFISGAYCC